MSRKVFINLSILGVTAMLALGFMLHDRTSLQWAMPHPEHAVPVASSGFLERAFLVYGNKKAQPEAGAERGEFNRSGFGHPD